VQEAQVSQDTAGCPAASCNSSDQVQNLPLKLLSTDIREQNALLQVVLMLVLVVAVVLVLVVVVPSPGDEEDEGGGGVSDNLANGQDHQSTSILAGRMVYISRVSGIHVTQLLSCTLTSAQNIADRFTRI
jgi:hypothetical protein